MPYHVTITIFDCTHAERIYIPYRVAIVNRFSWIIPEDRVYPGINCTHVGSVTATFEYLVTCHRRTLVED